MNIASKLQECGYLLMKATDEQISDAMRKYDVEFSDEVILMCKYISGRDGVYIDDFMIYGFNGFQKISDVDKAYSAYAEQNIFVFSDFSGWCWGYALDITSNGSQYL